MNPPPADDEAVGFSEQRWNDEFRDGLQAVRRARWAGLQGTDDEHDALRQVADHPMFVVFGPHQGRRSLGGSGW